MTDISEVAKKVTARPLSAIERPAQWRSGLESSLVAVTVHPDLAGDEIPGRQPSIL